MYSFHIHTEVNILTAWMFSLLISCSLEGNSLFPSSISSHLTQWEIDSCWNYGKQSKEESFLRVYSFPIHTEPGCFLYWPVFCGGKLTVSQFNIPKIYYSYPGIKTHTMQRDWLENDCIVPTCFLSCTRGGLQCGFQDFHRIYITSSRGSAIQCIRLSKIFTWYPFFLNFM